MVSVGLLLPPRFVNLSFATLAVFEAADLVLGEQFYDMHVVSASGGEIVNSLGMRVQTERGGDDALDTLLVAATPDTANHWKWSIFYDVPSARTKSHTE